MSDTRTATPAVRPGEVVITLVLLAVFVGGWLLAVDWPGRTALFPRIVTVLGAGLCLLKAGQLAVAAVRRRTSPEVDPQAAGPPGGTRMLDEEEEDELALEYIFASAGTRRWAEALAWVVAFFAGLWVVGMFWTLPVFTVLYLRIAGRTSLWAAVLYAAISQGILYLAFRVLLTLPIPRGML